MFSAGPRCGSVETCRNVVRSHDTGRHKSTAKNRRVQGTKKWQKL